MSFIADRSSRLLIVSLVLGLAACGDGVPRAPADGVDSGPGADCATNDDCSMGEICVNTVCTTMASPDGGNGVTDGGMVVTDGGMQACTADTWSNFAQNLIVNQCLSCHNHTHNFTNSYQSVKNNKTSMRRDVNSGAMPPRGSTQTLTSSERSRLVKWFDCSLPQ